MLTTSRTAPTPFVKTVESCGAKFQLCIPYSLRLSIHSHAVTVTQEADGGAGAKLNLGTIASLTIDRALVGWSDWCDEDGKPIEFCQANKELLPEEVIEDLALYVAAYLTNWQAEQKNVSAPGEKKARR